MNTRNLWKVVRAIMREQYDVLAAQFMRDSFYIVADFLAPHVGTSITQAEFDYFRSEAQAYATYRDDQWTKLEQQEGLRRPRAKPEGSFYDRGRERPIMELEEAWEQNRGWIFVEKSGAAAKISELSNYGWGVATVGRGFPTRLVRRLLRDDGRPALVFHDADVSGGAIFDVFDVGSRRTTHLDLTIDVEDLGLRYEDAEALGLPSQPEPPKYGGAARYEISALTVLEVRWGVENATLQYAKARIAELGYPLSPTELEREELWRRKARLEVDVAVSARVLDLVEEILADYPVDDGEAVAAETGDAEVELPELREVLKNAVEQLHGRLSFSDEEDWNTDALEDVDDRMREAVM